MSPIISFLSLYFLRSDIVHAIRDLVANIASVEQKKKLTADLHAMLAVSERDGFESDSYHQHVDKFRTHYVKWSNKGEEGAKEVLKW